MVRRARFSKKDINGDELRAYVRSLMEKPAARPKPDSTPQDGPDELPSGTLFGAGAPDTGDRGHSLWEDRQSTAAASDSVPAGSVYSSGHVYSDEPLRPAPPQLRADRSWTAQPPKPPQPPQPQAQPQPQPQAQPQPQRRHSHQQPGWLGSFETELPESYAGVRDISSPELSRSARHALFARQARYLADARDNYENTDAILRQWWLPDLGVLRASSFVYTDLSNAVLRSYVSWRTRFRAGAGLVPPASSGIAGQSRTLAGNWIAPRAGIETLECFIRILAAELLLGIGVKSPEAVLPELARLKDLLCGMHIPQTQLQQWMDVHRLRHSLDLGAITSFQTPVFRGRQTGHLPTQADDHNAKVAAADLLIRIQLDSLCRQDGHELFRRMDALQQKLPDGWEGTRQLIQLPAVVLYLLRYLCTSGHKTQIMGEPREAVPALLQESLGAAAQQSGLDAGFEQAGHTKDDGFDPDAVAPPAQSREIFEAMLALGPKTAARSSFFKKHPELSAQISARVFESCVHQFSSGIHGDVHPALDMLSGQRSVWISNLLSGLESMLEPPRSSVLELVFLQPGCLLIGTAAGWGRATLSVPETADTKMKSLLSAIDHRLRDIYGFRPLSSHAQLTGELVALIDQAVARQKEWERRKALPKITVNLSSLQSIRADAEITREALLVDEERGLHAAIDANAAAAADITGTIAAASTDIDVTIGAPASLGAPVRSDPGLDAPASTLKSPEPSAEATQAMVHTEEQAASSVPGLMSDEVAFLRGLIARKPGDSSLPPVQPGQSPELLIDHINGALFELLGDIYIDGDAQHAVLVDDYTADVLEALG